MKSNVWTAWNCCALLIAAGTAARAQEAKGAATHKGSSAAASAAKVWTSETTGKDYRVRIEKDHFYAEWVNLPAESVRQGMYIRSECRRVGSKCTGTSHVLLACAVGEGAKQQVVNKCRLVIRFEIESITPARITGRSETLRKWDCQTCKVSETGWGGFVWVPKVRKTAAFSAAQPETK